MASSRSLFASNTYDSDSDIAIEDLRRENILASQNILAAAMDSSLNACRFPFLQGDTSSSQGILRFKDMSPSELATFIDGPIYRDFADLTGHHVEQQLPSSSSAIPTRHSSVLPTRVTENRYTIPDMPPPHTPGDTPPPAAVAAAAPAVDTVNAAAAPAPGVAPIPAPAVPVVIDLSAPADVEDRDIEFSAPVDAASIIPNHEVDFLLTAPLGGRLSSPVSLPTSWISA